MSAMQEASAEGSRTQDASIEGFKDGASYDKFRPSYPDEAVDSLLKHLEVGGLKRARIIDLAAGTGKFTELLSQCPEGYEIVAVEPQDAMREALDKKGLRNVIVLKGEASSMPVESQRFDAVIVASVRLSNLMEKRWMSFTIIFTHARWIARHFIGTSARIMCLRRSNVFKVCQRPYPRRDLQSSDTWWGSGHDLDCRRLYEFAPTSSNIC